jgi:DUF1680 family protein
VRLTVTPDQASEFTLCLRIPGWALGRPVPGDLYRFGDPKVPPVGLKVNGQAADPSPKDDGYVHLQRRWQAGDVVELNLPMPVHRVYAGSPDGVGRRGTREDVAAHQVTVLSRP